MIDIDDTINDWTNEKVDSGPSYGPFLNFRYTNIQNPHYKPEVFFKSLYDEWMWTVIADATNVYARSKRVTHRCTDPTHPEYKKFGHLNGWIDGTPSDQYKNVSCSYPHNGLSTQVRSKKILEYEHLHKDSFLWQIHVEE